MLEIRDVRQSFRTGFWMKRAEILKGISFDVPAKSVFGFLGPNGAGKTTLIHLITGIKRPASGTLTLRGLDCADPRSRARIGYLPERPYFYSHLTGEGLLRYFGKLSGMDDMALGKRIPEALAAVGMTHARTTELGKYSKGMLQRVGIAQAILHDPEFLVLDEPVSGLDPVGRKEIRELILQLARDGKTIFFSSHVIPDVEAICDRIAVIRKGELLGCGPVSQFLASERQETEVAVAGLTLAQAAAFAEYVQVREMPDGIRGVVADPEALNPFLGKLVARDAKILWVAPIRPSLEDVFK